MEDQGAPEMSNFFQLFQQFLSNQDQINQYLASSTQQTNTHLQTLSTGTTTGTGDQNATPSRGLTVQLPNVNKQYPGKDSRTLVQNNWKYSKPGGSYSSQSKGQAPTPMKLDRVKSGNPVKFRPIKEKNKGSKTVCDEQKNEYKKQGLCFICGKKGHVAIPQETSPCIETPNPLKILVFGRSWVFHL
ncbi:3500_t:CDS:2 [Cetraspora pellucida]|uniref:3500_t:CDS:1 n=1 Tax=Cetraspora pellucida TaxID=1433469 RepID=A0ACA9PGC7_9GLOM|nr:3500_t:CDS:2 [Cetraspora pellucida]